MVKSGCKNAKLFFSEPLTPSQVHSALAYYFDHQEEVDTDIAESSDVEFWKSQIAPHPDQEALNI